MPDICLDMYKPVQASVLSLTQMNCQQPNHLSTVFGIKINFCAQTILQEYDYNFHTLSLCIL
jgi:hypothetical protein